LALKIDRVSKTFGAFNLRDVTLEVGEGEYFVLLGPTGAGKTLLLEVVAGFHHPDRGKITLNGRNVTDLPVEKRGIGYVPQSCPLFPHMSVFENVEFGLKVQGMAAEDRKEAVDSMLAMMDLEKMGGARALTLSGGERQKIVLARVLVTKPRVVLLDEPFTAIDAESSRILREELRRINRELKVSVLHVTHDQIEAFSLGSKVAIMRNGQIVQLGCPTEVLSNPVDEHVARFLGYGNIFKVRFVKYEKNISEVNAESVSLRLAGKLGDSEAVIAVRPDDIMIMTSAPPLDEEWNVFEGEIEEYTALGPIVEVLVDVGLNLKVFADKRSFLESNLVVGKHVYAAFKLDAVKVVGVV
jgi:molybdate/tungstate transport system ATP-binding protein